MKNDVDNLELIAPSEMPEARAAYWREIEHAELEGLSDAEVAAALAAYGFGVARILVDEDSDEPCDDDYRVSTTVTAKGLRSLLGQQRFLQRFCPEDE